MSLFLGDTPIAVNSSSRNIGEIIQSTIPLSDAGLHLLDGSLISGAGSYSAFVTYIAGLVSNYPDLFETEANWQTAVTTYGVCGKFVYDSVNNTVRLPKITGFTEGTIDPTTLGDLTEAGLPNITGEFSSPRYGYYDENINTGAFTKSYQSSRTRAAADGTGGIVLKFDASDSNSIYGNSSTVQPQSIKVLYYIVIASSTKTDIEVDIDEIATDLNGKADVDLSNVNNSGTSRSAGWSMPSGTYDDLTLGASGTTYTAPANGWFWTQSVASSATSTSSSSYFQFANTTSGAAFTMHTFQNANGYTALLPVKKGDVVSISYRNVNTSSAVFYFRFYYAVGSESEAS